MILNEKLKYYGIKQNKSNLFSKYLLNYKQFVVMTLKVQKSEMLTITTGVPQGSVHGPLLFITNEGGDLLEISL